MTKAELAVAACILLDISTKDIAAMQSVSIRTIENTKYRLYKKLGVPSAEVADYLRSFL
ncbi:MAG: LuxR C-terminal-related transcriptional regulator [Muribaculaceae bacterium]|nr:LuxR C-terminal-related transcriptional regulator [Muribaculaceae bacterium]